jgi:pimeloyl-ACP methyl ester carboxylesterase
MGGGEVARYLANYGDDRVSKAVLISSVTPYLLKSDSNPEGVDESIFEEIVTNLETDRPAFLQQFAAKFHNRSIVNHTVSDAFLQVWQGMANAASPRATLELVTAWSATDFRKDLEQIEVPTLIIHGTSDNTVPIDASGRRTVQLIPSARLLEYEGEPHGLTATAADRLNEDLLVFIKGGAETVAAVSETGGLENIGLGEETALGEESPAIV